MKFMKRELLSMPCSSRPVLRSITAEGGRESAQIFRKSERTYVSCYSSNGVARFFSLLPLVALVAIVIALPLFAQTAEAKGTANGVLLGSWNTQVEFDDVNVVSGTNVVLNDSFDAQHSGWQRERGDWQVADGVCRQTSSATPALMKFTFTHSATNYTVSIRAKKDGGAEGFLVGFGV